MAMNFWEAQRRARSRTTLYLVVFVLLTVLVAAIAEIAIRLADPEAFAEGPTLPYVGLAFIAITFLVAAYNYSSYLTQGGAYVAEALNAQRVSPGTHDPGERQLLNIVEEIALAASLPMPAVYILDAEEINAFAAGTSPENAAITITWGALNKLNRDEIQGVIAHEFGHIYNADMKISMRLAAMVMGFLVINYIGLRLLQGAFYRSRSQEDRVPNLLVLVAVIFALAGIVTWFFGSILKAMVSREREYLADACSVQFTRNPDGLVGALQKIERSTISDMPKGGMAYSHLYFNSHISYWESLFSSHPPLRKRIAAIKGESYMPEEWKDV